MSEFFIILPTFHTKRSAFKKKINQGPTYLPVKFKMAHEHD